jgi:hypothetical protein
MRISWISKYKSTMSCVYCGVSNPILLDFHHINPEKKIRNISSIKNKSDIITESSQCETVCANCHRKLHDGVNLCRLKTSIKEKNITANTTKNGT